MSRLEIRGLRAAAAGREIVHGVDLTVEGGEVHAVMGPNGAGKSTLSSVLLGKPGFEVLAGTVTLDGRDVLAMAPWERAVAGLHLVMQYPTEVPGVHLQDVLREALATRFGEQPDPAQLDQQLRAEASLIGFDDRLLDRPLNVDLSGGEKKRNETVQLAMLRPAIAILDELDSGLDIDALRAVSRRVEALTKETGLGVLAITHYSRLLHELHADVVHILVGGRIVASGGPELAERLDADGYRAFAPDATDAEELATTSAGLAPTLDPFADPLA